MPHQRLRSHSVSRCSYEHSHIAQLHRRVTRSTLQVSAKVQTAPKVVYVPNFLDKDEHELIRKESRRLQPQLREELNCIAQGRLGCYLPPNSDTVRIISSKKVAAAITQRLRSRYPLFLSEFPIELRQYPKGSDMPWHLDEQLYCSPQWEVIYTVDNSSDSRTEWRDEAGEEYSMWTEPNSLLAVEAEGWEHRVLPVKKGVRTILKMAFTTTNMKLPAFDANLNREAYSK